MYSKEGVPRMIKVDTRWDYAAERRQPKAGGVRDERKEEKVGREWPVQEGWRITTFEDWNHLTFASRWQPGNHRLSINCRRGSVLDYYRGKGMRSI
jgi:hypothetical protein